jgi:acetyl esterase/lipase
MRSISSFFLILAIFLSQPACKPSKGNNERYLEFLSRLQEEEAYISFFAAEKAFIQEISEVYLAARRDFFMGVSQCKEDPEEWMESFMKVCRKNGLIEENNLEAWEEVLLILSYELYANMPIFEFSTENIRAIRSITFAEYPNKKLELDLFLPEHPISEPVPAVICIHGGGFVVNRRIWFEPFAKYLASKGMAAVSIDYRKIPAVGILDCVYDSKAAVRWLRANASTYGIDPDRIGALGASAGAMLVATLATTADIPELEGSGGNPEISSEIQAVVGIATPAVKLDRDEELILRHGLSLDEAKLISPYENVSPSSAPLLLIHGTADETVDPQNARDLYEKFEEMGVHVELKWIPDEGHGFYEGNDLAIAMASEFFLRVL